MIKGCSFTDCSTLGVCKAAYSGPLCPLGKELGTGEEFMEEQLLILGGAIYQTSYADLQVSQTRFERVSAKAGGAIMVLRGGIGLGLRGEVIHCKNVFRHAFLADSQVVVSTSTFKDGLADSGAFIYVDPDSTLMVSSSSLVNSDTREGAVHIEDRSSAVILDTTFMNMGRRLIPCCDSFGACANVKEVMLFH